MVERKGQDPSLMGTKDQGHEEIGICTFCEIVAGRLPASKITETDRVLVFTALEDGYPLLVTKRHVTDILDRALDRETAMELGVLQVKMAHVVKEAEGVNSITIASNNGPDAGQEIPHLHVHIIPRFPNDNRVSIKRGTRLSREDLNQKAENYKSKL